MVPSHVTVATRWSATCTSCSGVLPVLVTVYSYRTLLPTRNGPLEAPFLCRVRGGCPTGTVWYVSGEVTVPPFAVPVAVAVLVTEPAVPSAAVIV